MERIISVLETFSTHILTRRMTDFCFPVLVHQNFFNSHPHKEDDLLHVCQCYVPSLFNSHPHKEDDRVVQTLRNVRKLFNSHPHKEDDRPPLIYFCIIDFSTHILTRRMTNLFFAFQRTNVFQLTSSQGG